MSPAKEFVHVEPLDPPTPTYTASGRVLEADGTAPQQGVFQTAVIDQERWHDGGSWTEYTRTRASVL